ncbi:hypothetical protein BH10PSE19_BH10PSE19_11230 [soil metagenome]
MPRTSILITAAPAILLAMESKAAKQAAVDHIEGKSSGINLCDPSNPYDSKMLEYATYSSRKRHPSLCFVFKPLSAFPTEYPPDRSSFHAQLQQFVMLRNKLNKPAAYFIAEKPGTEGSQQFIFGAFFGKDLFIMDPAGGTSGRALHDYTEALFRAKKDFSIENIYLSTTALQPDNAVGRVMSGPLCVEFMQHCRSRSFATVEDCFLRMRAESSTEEKSASLGEAARGLQCRLIDLTHNRLMPHFSYVFLIGPAQ